MLSVNNIIRTLIWMFNLIGLSYIIFNATPADSKFSRKYIYSNSYIYRIEAESPYKIKNYYDALYIFDNLGYNNAVKFTGKRPILVYETDKLNSNTLGQAFPTPYFCVIRIRSDLNTTRAAEVLLHEYLHCLGYSHVKDEKDLMAPIYNGRITINNIRSYARDVSKNIYSYKEKK